MWITMAMGLKPAGRPARKFAALHPFHCARGVSGDVSKKAAFTSFAFL
jgi:hypothetical protein